MEPVMRLAGLEIKILSGPVSLYYLEPSRPDLPIVMLLGDVHFSLSGMQQQCDEDEGCYTIYSDSILKGLDRVAERYPVDFYLEYAEQNISLNKGEDVLSGHLRHKIGACTKTASRVKAEYEDMCPARNVRWHYADVRYSQRRIESEASKIYYHFMTRTSLRIGESYLGEKIDPLVVNVYGEICRLIQRGAGDDEIAEQLLRITTHKNSICGKEMRKAPFKVDWSKIVHFAPQVRQIFSHYARYYGIYPKQGSEVLEALLGQAPMIVTTVHQQFIELMTKVFLHLDAIFVDLYVCARMIKRPVANTPSYLSLAMIGDIHIQNIFHFLTTELTYTARYEYSNYSPVLTGISRAVPIMATIDVDQSLREMEQTRGDDRGSYLEILQKERLARQIETKVAVPPEARRLYSIRSTSPRGDADLSPLQTLVGNIYQKNYIPGMTYQDASYLYNCSYELVDFIVNQVCLGYYEPARLPLLMVAAVIASIKHAYDLSTREIYNMFEKAIEYEKLLVIDMVTDIELRTDFQLCRALDKNYRQIEYSPDESELPLMKERARRLIEEALIKEEPAPVLRPVIPTEEDDMYS